MAFRASRTAILRIKRIHWHGPYRKVLSWSFAVPIGAGRRRAALAIRHHECEAFT
jgi:hypothetical protein